MGRVIQFYPMLFLSLYTYITFPLYPHNFLWFAAALFLFLLGMLRKPHETLLVAGVVLLGYGGYQLYLVYSADVAVRLGWNELIWLAVFPYAGIMGGIDKYVRRPVHSERLSLYRLFSEDEHSPVEEISTVDAKLEYIGGSAFVYKLEEEVLVTLRERRKIVLLLVEIDRFWEYKEMFGYDQSQWLLNQVAELINQLPDRPVIKAHLGGGTFAVVLPRGKEDDSDRAAAFQRNLSDSFTDLIMLRPRQENVIRVRLRYGAAECPADGIEARTLIDTAQSEIEGEEVQ